MIHVRLSYVNHPSAESNKTEIPKGTSAYTSIISAMTPSWFGKGKGKGDEKKDEASSSAQASMGKPNAMVFDKVLKRWVIPGAPVEEAKVLAPPPMGGPSVPANSAASSAQNSRANSPTPAHMSSGAPKSSAAYGTALKRNGTGKRNARSKYVDILNPNSKSEVAVASFLPPPMTAGASGGNIMMVCDSN